jgi:hypothetical protein
MNIINSNFVSLDVLALELCLPKRYLKELADTNAIPFLIVSRRKRFNPQAVQDVLNQIAVEKITEDGDTYEQ